MKAYSGKRPLIAQGWLRVILFLACYLAVMLTAAFLAGLVSPASLNPVKNITDSRVLLLAIALSTIVSLLMVWLFRTVIDRRSLGSLGFSFSKQGSHAGTGFFMGMLVICAGTLLLSAAGSLQWTGINVNGNELFLGFGLMVIIAFYEELVFRGYILNNLMSSFNKWVALIITSLLFAAAHAGNPGYTVIALLNLFLAGLLLGINYIYTKNLWFGMLLHLSWNFFQGPVFGFDVSGLNLQGMLQHETHGAPWLTGGSFGFEGSAVDTMLSAVAILALAIAYRKKFALAPKLPDAANTGPLPG